MGRNKFEGVPTGHFSVWWVAYSAEVGRTMDEELFAAISRSDYAGDRTGVVPMGVGFVACPRLAADVVELLGDGYGDVRVDGHQVYQDGEGVWRDGLFRMALPSRYPDENRGEWEMSGLPEHAWVKVFVPDGYPGDVDEFVRFKAAGLGRPDGMDAWDHVFEQTPAVRMLRTGDVTEVVSVGWPAGVLCNGVRRPEGWNRWGLDAHVTHTRAELTEILATPETERAADDRAGCSECGYHLGCTPDADGFMEHQNPPPEPARGYLSM